MHGREALLQYEKTLDCVHCGLCLAACPTYELFGRETTGPRGRVYLMRGLAEGSIEPQAKIVKDLDLCLVCRACEPVCPSGVRYGEMMEYTRSEVLAPARTGAFKERVLHFAVRHLLPFPRRLRLVARVLRVGDALGIRGWLRRTGWLQHISKDMAAREALLPVIGPAVARRPLPQHTAATHRSVERPRRGRVAVLDGCVMPLLLGDVNRATVRALAAQGFDVVTPEEPTCCGALSAHFGALGAARAAARRTIAAFESLGEVDAVVINSAGCGSLMKEYGRLIEEDEDATAAERASATRFASKVKDVSEFLVERGIELVAGRVGESVTYVDACHLAHGQGVRDAPRTLLAAIPGIEVIESARADRCCGAAGLYNAMHPDVSWDLLRARVADVRDTGATVLATGNPGCLIQWRAGIQDAGLQMDVRHPIELLDRAIAQSDHAE